MMRRGLILLVAALLLQSSAARTTPLDREGCAKLKTEQLELERGGARGNMGKGPQWAKANLEPDKLQQIQRLMEVDEQLLFRCHGKSLVNMPKETELEPGAGVPRAPKAAKRPKKETVKKAATTPTDQPAPAAPKDAPAASAGPPKPDGGVETKAPQKSAAAKKAKAKAKASDTSRAPSSEPGANPFANQPGPKP